MAENDNILTKLHDLLLYLVPLLAKFPRDQKFLLADRLQVKVMDVQESCLRAYYGRDKLHQLDEANMGLEIARHLVRLSYDLHLMNAQKYGLISERIDEVGRMLGGWLRKSRKPRATSVPHVNILRPVAVVAEGKPRYGKA